MEPHNEVNKLANITVKNIPVDLYEKLSRSAKINRRSINQEIIACIESSVQGKVYTPEQILEKARRLRDKTASHPISNDELRLIKGIKRL
jgi:antitoxin FitA